METYTRKVGQNRGKPRLWLEGKCLVNAGFSRGDRWTLYPVGGGFNIVGNTDGARKVSGKAEKPVIDIMGASLGELADAERVKITFEPLQQVMAVRDAEGSNT